MKRGSHLKEEETTSFGSVMPRINFHLSKMSNVSWKPTELPSYLDMLSVSKLSVHGSINIKLLHLNVTLLGGVRNDNITFCATCPLESGKLSLRTLVHWWRGLGRQIPQSVLSPQMFFGNGFSQFLSTKIPWNEKYGFLVTCFVFGTWGRQRSPLWNSRSKCSCVCWSPGSRPLQPRSQDLRRLIKYQTAS